MTLQFYIQDLNIFCIIFSNVIGGYNHVRNTTCGNNDILVQVKNENVSPTPAHHASNATNFINLRDPVYLLKDGKLTDLLLCIILLTIMQEFRESVKNSKKPIKNL